MRKIINLRIPFLIALILVMGVIVGYATVYYNLNYVWLTAIIVFIAVSLIVFFILKSDKRRLFLSIILLSVFIIGVVNCALRLNLFNQTDFVDGGNYRVEGTIISREEAVDGAYITIGFATANGNNVGGNIYAFIHETCVDGCEVGYKINFYTALEKKDAFNYGNFNTNAADNVKYFCRVYYGISIEAGFYPLGVINSAIRSMLFENLDYSTASIACGMLTGNTSAMEQDTLQNFRYGGIAHVFAVSGLHIGIVFGALSLLCKACKANKYISAAVCFLGIFFYAGICGFSASSVRAVIMCTVLLLSRLVYGKYDGLNSISISALIILLINPLRLFALGFQLSFMAVISIFLFSYTFKHWFRFLPEKISSALSVSLSVQVGSLPVMLNSFGYLSIAGIFLNVLIIPALSAIFVLILACVALSFIIMPLSGVLLSFACAPLQLITSALSYFGMENAVIRASGLSFLTPIWFLILLVITHRVNIKIPTRIIVSIISAFIIFATCIITAFSPVFGTQIIVSASFNGEGVVIKKNGQSVLILTEESERRFIEDTINNNCFIPPCAIVVVGGDESFSTVLEVGNLSSEVYLAPESIGVGVFGTANVNFLKEFKIFGIEFEYLNGYDLCVKSNNVVVAVSGGETTEHTSCDLFISKYANDTVLRKESVYFSEKSYKYNIYNYGDLHFTAKNGKLVKKGLNPLKESLY